MNIKPHSGVDTVNKGLTNQPMPMLPRRANPDAPSTPVAPVPLVPSGQDSKTPAVVKKKESIDGLEKLLKDPVLNTYPDHVKDASDRVKYLENLKK